MATATANKAIPDEVLDILRQGTWEDGGFKMPQMDRTLYQKTAKVLKALGGTWNRKAKATLFDDDGETAIREACETGEYVDLKKAYQFFTTPDAIADLVMDELELDRSSTFLEPSAGHGHLICAAERACDKSAADVEHCCAVELNPEAWCVLEAMAEESSSIIKDLRCGDFLTCSPDDLGEFSHIGMNPPFCKSQDIDHVRHAYTFLAKGGRLVSIMSPGFTFRSDRKAQEFRDWLDTLSFSNWFFLPDNSFASSGTNVRTVLLIVDKE